MLTRPVTVQIVNFRHVTQCSLVDRYLDLLSFVLYFTTLSVFQAKKCKVALVHAMKVYRGSRGIALLILNLGVSGGKPQERTLVPAE